MKNYENLYGVVKSVNPLLVHYTDKLVLDKDILTIPEYLEKGLCVGDALILIQREGDSSLIFYDYPHCIPYGNYGF